MDLEQLGHKAIGHRKPMPEADSLERGMKDSSWLVNLHLRTPTSVLDGNGFEGFLRPIWVLDFSSSLSMLG